jgi:hypothetical protein
VFLHLGAQAGECGADAIWQAAGGGMGAGTAGAGAGASSGGAMAPPLRVRFGAIKARVTSVPAQTGQAISPASACRSNAALPANQPSNSCSEPQRSW